jgi:mono/diheme cytochrome c family protein
MHRVFILSSLAAFVWTLAAQQHGIPPQAQRGRELFAKSEKGACAACHELGGVGTAVGPDLKTLSSAVGPHGIVMAMHMTLPAYVKEVSLKDGASFPAMEKGAQGDQTELWDLSQTPPALRKIATKDIGASKQSTTWKHPPAMVEYTSQELADLVGFLKWASTGSSKVIKPEDVEEAK